MQDVKEDIVEAIPYYIFKPSLILSHLLADPKTTDGLSALPDRTPDQRVALTQGAKWQTCPLFQHPNGLETLSVLLFELVNLSLSVKLPIQTCTQPIKLFPSIP